MNDEIKIGDLVESDELVYMYICKNAEIGWKTYPTIGSKPIKGIFLGYTYKQNGYIVDDDYGGKYLKQTSTIEVAVVQPIAGNMYRKPKYFIPNSLRKVNTDE